MLNKFVCSLNFLRYIQVEWSQLKCKEEKYFSSALHQFSKLYTVITNKLYQYVQYWTPTFSENSSLIKLNIKIWSII